MSYPSSLGAYLAANHPSSPAYAYQDGSGAVHLVGWPEDAWPAPTVEQVEAWTPSPVPGVISALALWEQQAAGKITTLKAKAAIALVVGGMPEPEAYAAGSAFVVAFAAQIQAYILAGGNPVAGQALIDAIVAAPPAWWSAQMLALFESELL